MLHKAWSGGLAVQSNFARAHAEEVAAAASLGLITTEVASGIYGRSWMVTAGGMLMLQGRG